MAWKRGAPVGGPVPATGPAFPRRGEAGGLFPDYTEWWMQEGGSALLKSAFEKEG